MKIVTEQESNYDNLEKMSAADLLNCISKEDETIAAVVKAAIPQIEVLVKALTERMKKGGRLFYIGAGTSGRLGVIDASECPPTYGVPSDMVIGIIAGGDRAIRNAVENAEDNEDQAWKDMEAYHINAKDAVIGIAASGTTPYVLKGLERANQNGCLTGCVVCNDNSPIGKVAAYPVEVVTGPEFVTGSTRMKAGTATKLVLNMISTAVMIGLGRVQGNKMIDMKLSNAKLQERGIRMVMQQTGLDKATAAALLVQHGSVRNALQHAASDLLKSNS